MGSRDGQLHVAEALRNPDEARTNPCTGWWCWLPAFRGAARPARAAPQAENDHHGRCRPAGDRSWRAMNAALYYWHATRRRAQRRAVVVATVRQIERLPGVLSGEAWLGLGANPIVHGRVDDSFVTDAVAGSLDGEFFRQDGFTVVAGKLPRPGATNEIVITPQLATDLHLWVGGRLTYQFSQLNLQTQRVTVTGNSTFVVTAIVDQPPVLVDQFDEVAGALLPPAATARYLNGQFAFAWVGVRLRAGAAGIPALERELTGPQDTLDRVFHVPAGTLNFNIRRLDTVHKQVQQAIEPQAVALAIFGGLAALALLVLAAQALAQLLDLSAAGVPAMRAVGVPRGQAALAVSLDGAAAVVGGMMLAGGGGGAVSPPAA